MLIVNCAVIQQKPEWEELVEKWHERKSLRFAAEFPSLVGVLAGLAVHNTEGQGRFEAAGGDFTAECGSNTWQGGAGDGNVRSHLTLPLPALPDAQEACGNATALQGEFRKRSSTFLPREEGGPGKDVLLLC